MLAEIKAMQGGAGASGDLAVGLVGSVVESVGTPRVTTITWDASDPLQISMTDATTAGTHGGAKIYDLPAGNILVLGAVTDIAILAGAGGLSDTAAVVAAIGNAAVATDNETLTGAEASVVPSTAATLTGGAGVFKGQSTAPATLDGTSAAADLHLNFAAPDADSSSNDTLDVTGTVTVTWIPLGDH